MAAPPSKTELVDTYPNPSTGVFKAGLGKFYDFVVGLLGSTGNAAEARDALGLGQLISYRNLVVNGSGQFNQRGYVSDAATTVANQVTLDRWRVVVAGQNLAFGAGVPGQGRTITFPAGGADQIIEAAAVKGGVHTLSWTGTATATVNGAAITNGGQTAALPAYTAVTLRMLGGTGEDIQFERGSVKTPTEQRPPQIELALCQRDYAKSYAIGTTPGSSTGVGRYWVAGNVANSIAAVVRFPVPMRAAPTVRCWEPGGAIASAASLSSGGVVTTRAASATNVTDLSAEISASVSTDVVIAGHWDAATGF